MDYFPDLTIRPASPADAAAVERLAQLDSSERPPGRLLLAEAAGEVIAAISLTSGAVVADPFKRTAEPVRLLSVRREQLVEVERPRPLAPQIAPQL
jgi:hypothetical protein